MEETAELLICNDMINVYKILPSTNVEGPGNRFCIWVQGCHKHCEGCYAKETWSFDDNKLYSVIELFNLIKSTKGIEGVTFLGGEPFEQAKLLCELSKLIKSKGMSVVCFSGYTLEELNAKHDDNVDKFLENIDLLIDGGYEKENFDLSRPWVGSSNQRYHFLTDFYNYEQIKQYKNKIEVRLSENGRVDINGMGDFDSIKESLCLHLGKNNVKFTQQEEVVL